jgi:hypothetical protein
MSVASDILEAVAQSRQASAKLLEYYYSKGVISIKDLETYTSYLVDVNDQLEFKLQAIFGVCESRLQTKGIK